MELDGATHPPQVALPRPRRVRAVRRRIRRRRAGAGRGPARAGARSRPGRSATACGSSPGSPVTTATSGRIDSCPTGGSAMTVVDRRGRAAPVRAVRDLRPRDGVDRRSQGARRRGHHVERRRLRRRRQSRQRSRLGIGQRARPHGRPVHRRLQRLRHRRLGDPDLRPGDRVGCRRGGIGSRLRQARPGSIRLEPGRLRPARLVRRGRPDGHHPVLRPQDPALPARPRPRPTAARRARRQVTAQRVDHTPRMAPQGGSRRRDRGSAR